MKTDTSTPGRKDGSAERAWRKRLAKLRAFKDRSGHTNVPANDPDKSLGSWAAALRMRRKKGALTEAQVRQLDELGFVWDLHRAGWLKRLDQLRAFKKLRGHANPSAGGPPPGLGAWVVVQRGHRRKGRLSAEQIRLLDELGVAWERPKPKPQETWKHWYHQLEKYVQAHGHPHVHSRDKKHASLAHWVSIQRTCRRKPGGDWRPLSREQVALLDKLGFSWDVLADQWARRFEQLRRFKKQHGHCEVESVPSPDLTLVRWLYSQRCDWSAGTLEVRRKKLLARLGVSWKRDAWGRQWEAMYVRLRRYRKSHGNADVPQKWPADQKLARWVERQREWRRIGQLKEERARRLEELGFTWRRHEYIRWEDRLAELTAFKAKHGHCHLVLDGTSLGRFLRRMRRLRNSGGLAADRVAQLDALGFPWKAQRMDGSLLPQKKDAEI